jgi:hypothetical protein
MPSRRNESTLPNEKHLQEYRGRESYEQQSKTGRGGRSAAFPQHDYPTEVERHPQPQAVPAATPSKDAADEYALDDDYSRTDYGPRPTQTDPQEREELQRDNLQFVNGGYAPQTQERGVSKVRSALRGRRGRGPAA